MFVKKINIKTINIETITSSIFTKLNFFSVWQFFDGDDNGYKDQGGDEEVRIKL